MSTFKWLVEFEVDEAFIEDGFNLTDQRAHEMLAGDLRYARNDEISARVIKAPPPLKIARAQGYSDASTILREIAEGKGVPS